MITAVIKNDILGIFCQKTAYLALVLLLGLGLLAGLQFKISLADGVPSNAPYNLGFMLGLLSLGLIFIATLVAFTLLFNEKDANFGLIVFSTPVQKSKFALSRFCAFYSLTMLAFMMLILGFVLGSLLKAGTTNFNLWHYGYPFLLFGCTNALFICMLLFWVAQSFQNKLLVALAGLALYVLYMIIMLYANAPFMAQALPQSVWAQKVSALTDPFGLSAYFTASKDMSILERNSQLVALTNYFGLNRLIYLVLSCLGIYAGCRTFSFMPKTKRKAKTPNLLATSPRKKTPYIIPAILPSFNTKTKYLAGFSFFKLDALYLFKSIALVSTVLLLLFYVGVEMYADIDMGIRFPEKYASSGLLAQTINGIFYTIGGLALVYFVNDLYWRSDAANFNIIQNTTFYARQKLMGHLGSIVLLVCLLTIILLITALSFQITYGYYNIDWHAYWGNIVFNSLPLLLLGGYLLFINHICKQKNIALVVTILFFFLCATPMVNYVLTHRLFQFLSGYTGTYSVFIGYGPYLAVFGLRLFFGFSILGFLFVGYFILKNQLKHWVGYTALVLMLTAAILSAAAYQKHYQPKDKDQLLATMVAYEKTYRKYENLPQPTIKKVISHVALVPEKQSYTIKGNYLLKNLHTAPIDSILLSVPPDFKVGNMVLKTQKETITLQKVTNALVLKHPLQPKDTARLYFELSYQWQAVNRHHPFNAIIKDGSFIRISRYFPFFGYDADREIKDEEQRKAYHLGQMTAIKPLAAARNTIDDFIDLEMQISLPQHQTAVGTGVLQKEWQEDGQNHFLYKAKAIPFRFALAAAQYNISKAQHDGVNISVLYHPLHGENVANLIKNTKLTLAYCSENFGPYPFSSLAFAEVSSFTQGFNGTAYPGVIFMTENMAFHANVQAGDNEDVINELAGHEVAHFWWGNNQISPDYREGYAMLTESLAMYTEMMVYKALYGKEKMLDRLAVQEQIYESQKGFHPPMPLIKATKQYPDVAYNKGAVVFVALSELIGEKQLNMALKNFLNAYKYPNPKPITTDLLQEILKVARAEHHQQIKEMFWGT